MKKFKEGDSVYFTDYEVNGYGKILEVCKHDYTIELEDDIHIVRFRSAFKTKQELDEYIETLHEVSEYNPKTTKFNINISELGTIEIQPPKEMKDQMDKGKEYFKKIHTKTTY